MNVYEPHTFTEKLQWYKVFYNHPELSLIVDKYEFKKYIEKKLGAGFTIPVYGVWEDIKSLRRDWDALPEEFCLKSTVQSDGKFIKMIHNKSSISFFDIKKEIKEWFVERNTLINSYCSAYYNCKPRVTVQSSPE